MFEAHLHPVLSSIPFALITLAVIGESAAIIRKQDFSQLVSWCTAGAVLAIVGSFLSGYLAADYANTQLGIHADDISIHHLFGKALLILAMITIIVYFVSRRASYNKSIFCSIFRILLVSLWVLSMITGFRGGEMLLRPRTVQVP